MRLINVATQRLEEFVTPPEYAILSHTWGDGEITFEDMSCPDVQTRKQYAKVQGTIDEAKRRNIQYVWIDTCCIDKRSSAELSEAINSMFQWYQAAVICFAFLEDLNPDADLQSELEACRWFTRGWTLQELIAPKDICFFDQEWNERGTKETLCDSLSRTTGIQDDVLLGETMLGDVLVAVKMSWAANRKTTRLEDVAYCLLGIFDVNMSLIYGEGPKAFLRLQEEIIKRSSDTSIFVWDAINEAAIGPYCGILATSPDAFWGLGRDLGWHAASTSKFSSLPEFTITNKGLRITTELMSFIPASSERNVIDFSFHGHFIPLSLVGLPATLARFSIVGLWLKKVAPGLFVRYTQIHPLTEPALAIRMADAEEYTIPQTIYMATTYSTSLLANRQWIQFATNPYLVIDGATPRSNWDSSNKSFFTNGVGRVSPFGLVSGRINDETGSTTSHRVGILLRGLRLRRGALFAHVSVFAWDSSIKLATPDDVVSQRDLSRFHDDMEGLPAIEFEDPVSALGGEIEETNDACRRKYRVSVSAEMTSASTQSVSFQVSTKDFIASEQGGGSWSEEWTELTGADS